ncbi:hypothetical protein [Halobellus ordinarius]|uniref:hypothetical protein n=1 Tax=Halobellus ordinarius TaxID=3075120 RepID=UPI0028802881|nr:hypothetical protein [Halobellus sp. ZY16]
MSHDEDTSSAAAAPAGRPTRPAERNRDLVDRPEPGIENPLLPSLERGLTLLDVDGGRGVSILQALVLDHLLLHDGPAFWVDADGHATTTGLARIAPSRRLLDRIAVARGFTPYQHYSAVRDVSTAVNRRIRATASRPADLGEDDLPGHDGEDGPGTPSLVVAPALDSQYRAADTLADRHARTLQARTLARLRTYADAYDVPVLVTRTAADAFTGAIETAAERHLECERTRLGPRFVGREFETLVYPAGAHYQTTLAYWRRVLGARAEQVGLEPSPSTPADSPSEPVGTAVTAAGAASSFTANPLLDAWPGAGGR